MVRSTSAAERRGQSVQVWEVADRRRRFLFLLLLVCNAGGPALLINSRPTRAAARAALIPPAGVTEAPLILMKVGLKSRSFGSNSP